MKGHKTMKVKYIKVFSSIFIIALFTVSSSMASDSAGVFLYFKDGNQTWVLLGHDGSYGNWSDFGGGKKNIDSSLKDTALRELGEETRFIYGNTIPVELEEPYETGKNKNYLQYFAKIPFTPIPILCRSSPNKLLSDETEVNAYMWIPLESLLNVVQNKPNKNDYRDIKLPENYIPKDKVPYVRERSVEPYLREELAKTLDMFNKNKGLMINFIK